LWLLPAAYAALRLSLEHAGAPEWEIAIIDVAFLIGFLYTLTDDVERTIAEMGIHGLYNVMVVSWVAAIPQTVVALYFAQAGRHAAAFYDSMVSTLVDAFIVTALVRLQYLDAIRRDWHLIAAWVAATLAFGATVDAPARLALPAGPYYWAWFAAGAFGLPFLFARGIPAAIRIDVRAAVNLAVYTALVIYVSWDLGRALSAWHASEAQLGAVAAIMATMPDLITALLIRATLSRMIAEHAAAEDAIRTMFAAAIHDQISVPALVALIAPASVAAFPHWLNVYVSVLKFTLLGRRAFLLLGLPAALAATIYLIAAPA